MWFEANQDAVLCRDRQEKSGKRPRQAIEKSRSRVGRLKLSAHPSHTDLWAGLAAAAGGSMSDDYVDEDAIRHIPFLVLHGSEDGTVPVERSRESVARMKKR